MMHEATGCLLKSAPKQWLRPGQWYSRPEAYLPHLQVAWVQGRYEAMWLGFLRGQLDGRYFPLSDHHIRGLSVIGEAELCLQLFQQLYNRNPAEFQLGSVSNMLFMALGSEQLVRPLISTLTNHFQQLSAKAFSSLPSQVAPAAPKPLVGAGETSAGGGVIRLAPASRRPFLAADCPSASRSLSCNQCFRSSA